MLTKAIVTFKQLDVLENPGQVQITQLQVLFLARLAKQAQHCQSRKRRIIGLVKNVDAINEISDTVITDLLEVIEQKKAIVFLTEKLPKIEGYPILLSIVFRNLIDNAIKFAKPDVPPHITISSESTHTKMQHGKDSEHYLQITFEDNGIGFDSSQDEEIFEIFKRLDERCKGVGIGLAVCRKIMSLHGGFIKAESVIGKGSTFCCFFPVISER